MRYSKIQTPEGPLYVSIEDREGQLWAAAPIAPPEDDPLPSIRPAVTFRPAPLDTLALLPPVRPSKIVCIGRNYRDHAAELGNDAPTQPLLFLKPPSSLLAPGGVILHPLISQRVDYEGELALIVGRPCHRLAPDADVRPYLRGITLVNDVTARDLQRSEPQWTRAKGFDTFCPCGPIVSTLEDALDPLTQSLTLTTHVNGELRQTGSTADLIFPIPELLRFISHCMTLFPGDLVPTGTPAGVGPLHPGDRVEISIPGLGTLANTVAAG